MTTGLQRETGYLFDALLEFQASVTDTTSDNSSVLDLGAIGAGDNEDGVADFGGDVVIDISAIIINDNNESYTFTVVGSDNTDFTTGDQEDLQSMEVGALEILLGDVDSDTGRYILPIRNKRNTRSYRFIRVELVISGTTPSITWSAFLSKSKVR